MLTLADMEYNVFNRTFRHSELIVPMLQLMQAISAHEGNPESELRLADYRENPSVPLAMLIGNGYVVTNGLGGLGLNIEAHDVLSTVYHRGVI